MESSRRERRQINLCALLLALPPLLVRVAFALDEEDFVPLVVAHLLVGALVFFAFRWVGRSLRNIDRGGRILRERRRKDRSRTR